MKRIKLADRQLPDYTRNEERANMGTHIAGGLLGVTALVLCLVKAASDKDACGVVAAAVYGASLILLYTVSSVYHGLRPGMGKKVMQVIDHCTIYLLIAGSYTAVSLAAFRPLSPALGWGMFAFQWALAALAVSLTAIDLKRYRVFSMVCYLFMGWAILPFLPQTMKALGPAGFWLLFTGGVAYTIGAVLYGIGAKKRWMHTVFHVFVVLGSLLQFLAIYLRAL